MSTTNKKSTAKFAVITRTKNRNNLLKRALESVDSQTYKDYQHFILNDGGDKKALEELLKKYKNPRRKVVHNGNSVGLVKALNQAIKSSEGEYITILDDDDSWEPDKLEKVAEYLEVNNSVAVVASMDIIFEEVASGGQVVKKSQQPHPDSGGEISLYKQCYRNHLSNGAITYKRSVYDELKGYDESLPTAEDWDFGIRLLLNYDVGFVRSKKPLIHYHQRPSVDGEMGNSVHAGVLTQEQTINVVRNRYLRTDIKSGVMGVGYIMNKLDDDNSNVVRLESHINRTAVNLQDYIFNLIKNMDPAFIRFIKHLVRRFRT